MYQFGPIGSVVLACVTYLPGQFHRTCVRIVNGRARTRHMLVAWLCVRIGCEQLSVGLCRQECNEIDHLADTKCNEPKLQLISCK